MPHVSKRKLDEVTQDKIFRKLVVILERAHNLRKSVPVLDELLTETERIMLAKRLAVVMMLFGDTPQHKIAEALYVSPTTVSKISLQIERGAYSSIKSLSKSERVDLEKAVWLLLTAGGILPPRAGGRYWRRKGYKSFIGR